MATNISFSTYGFMNGILILSEENWRRFFKPFITDSVQSGLATIAGANMTVYVSAGECRCGAVMGILDEMIALDVANGDSTYDRIDSVIVQYTYGEPSTLAVAIVQGTPSTNPVPPTLTKVYDTLWQMEIAQILVPSGATSSSEFTITDKRVIYESIESIIDDNTESEERVWSSQKSREEIVSLSTEIYDSLNTKADVIERTVSGDIVTFTDGGNNLPVKELVVDIESVQDLHGYDNPWPAGGGKNLLNMSWLSNQTVNGITFTNNDGQITINGTATATTNLNGPIFVLPAGTYSLSGSISNNQLYLYDNDNNVTIVESVNGTSNSATISESKNVYLRVRVGSGASVSGIVKPQLELGSSVTSYAPYSNICPISGWSSATVTRTGKNLVKIINSYPRYPSSQDGITATVNSDGSIRLAGTKSSASETYIWCTLECGGGTYGNSIHTPCFILPKGNYSISGIHLWSRPYINISKNMTRISPICYYNETKTFTLTNDTPISNVNIGRIAIGDQIDTVIYPQLVYWGEETPSTEYIPYNGQTVTIDLDGTRYGGELNVLTGEMTVTKAIVDLGTLTWGYDTTNKFFRATIDNGVTNYGLGVIPDIITSMYKTVATKYGNTFPSSPDYIVTWSRDSSQVQIKNTDYTTAATFKTAMSGVQLVYKLATPITVQLTPSQLSTLLGQNNIWADTGDVAVEYRADTKRYIEQKVADTNRKTCEIMTIVTDSMVAPKNLTSGDLVIVGDDLYKATSNIASGATLTVGTNVSKLTLAEYIQSLL